MYAITKIQRRIQEKKTRKCKFSRLHVGLQIETAWKNYPNTFANMMEITKYAYARPVESNSDRSSTTDINKYLFSIRPQHLRALNSIVYKPRSFTIDRLKRFIYLQTQHNSQVIESRGNTWMRVTKLHLLYFQGKPRRK